LFIDNLLNIFPKLDLSFLKFVLSFTYPKCRSFFEVSLRFFAHWAPGRRPTLAHVFQSSHWVWYSDNVK